MEHTKILLSGVKEDNNKIRLDSLLSQIQDFGYLVCFPFYVHVFNKI